MAAREEDGDTVVASDDDDDEGDEGDAMAELVDASAALDALLLTALQQLQVATMRLAEGAWRTRRCPIIFCTPAVQYRTVQPTHTLQWRPHATGWHWRQSGSGGRLAAHARRLPPPRRSTRNQVS